MDRGLRVAPGATDSVLPNPVVNAILKQNAAAMGVDVDTFVIGPELAKSIVRTWLRSEFAGGGSARKVAKIAAADGAVRPSTPTA